MATLTLSQVRSIVDVAKVQQIIAADEAARADATADRVCAMYFRIRQRLA